MPYLLNNLRDLVDHLNLEYYLIAELEGEVLVLAFSLWTGIVPWQRQLVKGAVVITLK